MAAAAKVAHRVTATMIVVRVPGAQGGETYLRRGRDLPASVEPGEVKRLLSLGLIEKYIPQVVDGTAETPPPTTPPKPVDDEK